MAEGEGVCLMSQYACVCHQPYARDMCSCSENTLFSLTSAGAVIVADKAMLQWLSCVVVTHSMTLATPGRKTREACKTADHVPSSRGCHIWHILSFLCFGKANLQVSRLELKVGPVVVLIRI